MVWSAQGVEGMSSSATVATRDGGPPAPRTPRHALIAGLGASALVHAGLALGALTLTTASTHSEMLAIMELAPAPADAPAPPEPQELPAPSAVTPAVSRPHSIRKAAPRKLPTSEPAPLSAAASASEAVAAPKPAAHVAQPAPQRPPVQSAGTARSPSVLSQVEPSYPAAARRDRIHGVVRVEVQLDQTGRIVALHVRKSIPVLDAAALAALRQWRFSPARDERGTAIPAVVVVPVRFVLR